MRYKIPVLLITCFFAGGGSLAVQAQAPAQTPAQAPQTRGDQPRQAQPSVDVAQGWRFLRTPNPQGGRDVVGLTRTVDMARSGPDVAGLWIRCGEQSSTEVLIVLTRSLTLRAKPIVVVNNPGLGNRIPATVAVPGTALLLPADTAALLRGSWQNLDQLSITIENAQERMSAVVPFAGLSEAMDQFATSCATAR